MFYCVTVMKCTHLHRVVPRSYLLCKSAMNPIDSLTSSMNIPNMNPIIKLLSSTNLLGVSPQLGIWL